MPIICGKDCTFHDKTRSLLKSLGLSLEDLYLELGVLLARHYSKCTLLETERHKTGLDEPSEMIERPTQSSLSNSSVNVHDSYP